jgi:hypothetical protein
VLNPQNTNVFLRFNTRPYFRCQVSGFRCQAESQMICVVRASRVGLDSAEPFGSELTAEGLVAWCADRIQNFAIICVRRVSRLQRDPTSDTPMFSLKPDT